MQTLNNVFTHAWKWLAKWVGRPIIHVATSAQFWQAVVTGLFLLGTVINISNIVLGFERQDRGLLGNGIGGLVLSVAGLMYIREMHVIAKRGRYLNAAIEVAENANRDIQRYRDRLAEQAEQNERALYVATLNTKGARL